MENVLIAFNDDPSFGLHSFFESCADDARQTCIDHRHSYSWVYPPHFTEDYITAPMVNHTICFIAADGTTDGIYNVDGIDVLTTRTTNYNLSGKILYTVSCYCAIDLLPELKRIGLSTFVGYDDELLVKESESSFQESAMEGLKVLLSGENKTMAKQKMLDKYVESINKATSIEIKAMLAHNREHLCFE